MGYPLFQEFAQPIRGHPAHVVDRFLVQLPEVRYRGVAPLEDQGQLLGFAAHRPEPLRHKGLPDNAKGLGVVPVARIDLVVEGKRALPVLEQRQRALPQIPTLLLVLAPLGQLRALVEGVDVGEEVRRVVLVNSVSFPLQSRLTTLSLYHSP